MTALRHHLQQPFALASVVVFIAAAYLCLVNLDYAPLWHDEAPAVFFARQLLAQGDIIGWDGRNLVGGSNGRTLTPDLRDPLPPITYLINAFSLSVWGQTIVGARIGHAILGIIALACFYLLLRQQIPNTPNAQRLIFFIFTFSALSAQLLLFFRQSRYFAFMILTTILVFYFYERFWRSKHLRDFALMTLCATLAFFNQYLGGMVMVLTLAIWHLTFRAKETTAKEYMLFTASGVFVAACGIAYFIWLGLLFGGSEASFLEYTGTLVLHDYEGELPLTLLVLWIYLRDTAAADWLPLPIIAWLLYFLWTCYKSPRKKKKKDKNPTAPAAMQDDTAALLAAARLVWFGVVFVFLSGLLSVQPIWIHPYADLRYFVAALPFLLVSKGMLTEWAWAKDKLLGGIVGIILLLSSVTAAPYNIQNIFNNHRHLGLLLFDFIGEIHRPYNDAMANAAHYLLKHGKQDELVFVPSFNDRESLIIAIGSHFIFCCGLDGNTKVPKEKMESLNSPFADAMYLETTHPDWILTFGQPISEEPVFTFNEKPYALEHKLEQFHFPTHRPELNYHSFEPIPIPSGVYIYRRRG